MNFRHLQILVAVVECRGVSKAADRLNVSQPAVSAALKGLETEVGTALFERFSGGRRTRPTVEGLKLYERARDILNRWEAAKRSLVPPDNRPPKIRVGVLHTLPADQIARAQMTLRGGARDWRWSLREGSAAELAEDLQRERLDILWTVIDGAAPESRPLWQEPYVAMVAKAHPLARSGRLTIRVADLAGERIVLRGTCELPRNALQQAGLSIRPAASADRDELALALVAREAGFAIAPRSLATASVVALSVSDLGLSRLIGLRWRRAVAPDAVEAVAAVLSEP